jgi:hypothetical protein
MPLLMRFFAPLHDTLSRSNGIQLAHDFWHWIEPRSASKGRIYAACQVLFAALCAYSCSILCTNISAAELTATQLDGTTVVGELKSWSDERIIVTTPNGEQSVASEKIASIRWASPSSPPHSAASRSGLVELIDSSRIPIKGLRVTGTSAVVELESPGASDNSTVTLTTKQLATVQLSQFDEKLTAQWNEIRNLKLASDLLVALKHEGKSLDYSEGVVGDITDDKVEFKIDGQSVRADRAKVAGIIYFRADGSKKTDPRFLIQSRSGLRAAVSHVKQDGSELKLTTVAGAVIRWPLDDVKLADFSAGKIVYLSDIEPASERWTPLVGLPAGAGMAAEYGQPRRDKSGYGGPLRLATKADESTSPAGHLQSFGKGLSIRSRTEIAYRLPAGFRRFVTLAGIDPASNGGNVRLTILADSRTLFEGEFTCDGPPQPIELDIASARQLKFVVDFGQNLDTGDWLNLCDARIVK